MDISEGKIIMSKIEDVIGRLREPSASEDVMKTWDNIRAMLISGVMGTMPRDIFESLLDGIDELKAEAADIIETLKRQRAADPRSGVERSAPPLRVAAAKGETLDQMIRNARESGLYKIGDMKLMWVNEGDLYCHSVTVIE